MGDIVSSRYLSAGLVALAAGVLPANATVITSFGGNMVTAAAAVPTSVVTNTSGTVNISIGAGLAGSSITDPILLDLTNPGYVPVLGQANIAPTLVVSGGWGSVEFEYLNPGTLESTPATNGGVFSIQMKVIAESGSNDFGGIGQLWQFNLSYSFVTFLNGAYTTDQGIAQTNAFNANRITQTIPEPSSMAIWGVASLGGMALLRRRRVRA